MADECALRQGGCWHKNYFDGVVSKTFSACHDNFPDLKVNLHLLQGLSISDHLLDASNLIILHCQDMPHGTLAMSTYLHILQLMWMLINVLDSMAKMCPSLPPSPWTQLNPT